MERVPSVLPSSTKRISASPYGYTSSLMRRYACSMHSSSLKQGTIAVMESVAGILTIVRRPLLASGSGSVFRFLFPVPFSVPIPGQSNIAFMVSCVAAFSWSARLAQQVLRMMRVLSAFSGTVRCSVVSDRSRYSSPLAWP